MKKYIIAIFALALVLGLVKTSPATAQDYMQVSPRTWVLESSGVESVNIHLAIPFSAVDRESLVVDVSGDFYNETFEGLDLRTYADLRGDLVIRFTPNFDIGDVGDILTVTVTGEKIDGESIDVSYPGVVVKEATMLNN